jgi:hypothetical protein
LIAVEILAREGTGCGDERSAASIASHCFLVAVSIAVRMDRAHLPEQ